jgi:hypothetical protein
MQVSSRHASWQSLLATPDRPAHMVQLCESDEALAHGAAYFVAAGIERGEAIVLTGTQPHLAGIRRALAASGIDAEAAERNGQITAGDAHQAVEAVTVDGLPDRARFEAVAGEVLARVSADTRFPGVRWWGEMSNVYHALGNRRGMLLDEEIGDAIARAHGVSLLCTFQCDRLDPASYDGLLQEVCRRHSHVIHADDYPRHRVAVNRAIAEVIGNFGSAELQSLFAWKGMAACDLPSSQAVLFWLRETMPGHFREVLEKTRQHLGPEAL